MLLSGSVKLKPVLAIIANEKYFLVVYKKKTALEYKLNDYKRTPLNIKKSMQI